MAEHDMRDTAPAVHAASVTPDSALLNDTLHPNAAGAAIITTALYAKLVALGWCL